MKSYLTIITLFIALSSNGQSIKLIKNNAANPLLYDLTLKILIADSNQRVVAYQKKDSQLVVVDSATTIIKLLDLVQRKQKDEDKLYAAQYILNYVNTKGYVLNKNRKKFNAAVRKYMKIVDYNAKYDTMQNLDILVRDNKGKALGWINQ